MIKKKNEAKCTTEWLREMKRKEWVRLYKIVDSWIQRNPFDIVGVVKWKPVAIEAKFCSTLKEPTLERWLKKLEPHQVVNLDKFMAAWWDSYILIFHHDSKWGAKLYKLNKDENYVIRNEFKKKFYILLDKWKK